MLNPEAEAILNRATATQVEWVVARVLTRAKQDAAKRDAAKRVGIHEKTPYTWENRLELERAVDILRRNVAVGAVFMLQQMAAEAINTLVEVMRSNDTKARVQAAREILSRVVPEQMAFDMKGPVLVEYVNDWRAREIADATSGTNGGEAAGPAFQLVERGAALAKDDNGHVHSGGNGTCG